jgi:hypothetical protein
VNHNRLTRKLRRELTANPKKAAVLGLLALVAMYFWAPLVWGWVGGRGKAEKAAAKVAPVEGVPVPLTATAQAVSAVPQGTSNQTKESLPAHPWDRLAQWMDQDSRMQPPAGEFADSRDPFQAVEETIAEPETEESEKEETAATPEDLGLVLSSTLVGPQRSIAMINGKPYRQGRTVELKKNGQTLEFVLKEVHPRRIILQRQDKQFELTIPRPAL